MLPSVCDRPPSVVAVPPGVVVAALPYVSAAPLSVAGVAGLTA